MGRKKDFYIKDIRTFYFPFYLTTISATSITVFY